MSLFGKPFPIIVLAVVRVLRSARFATAQNKISKTLPMVDVAFVLTGTPVLLNVFPRFKNIMTFVPQMLIASITGITTNSFAHITKTNIFFALVAAAVSVPVLQISTSKAF